MPGVDLHPADVGDHPESCLPELRPCTWLPGSTVSERGVKPGQRHGDEAVIIQRLLPGERKETFRNPCVKSHVGEGLRTLSDSCRSQGTW